MRPILLFAPLWLLLLGGGGGCGSSYTLEGTPTFDMGDARDLETANGLPGLPLNPLTIPVPGGQRSLAVADLDQDKKPDVVATLPYQGKLALLWNPGLTGASMTLLPAPGRPYGLALADLNGDMAPDVAVTDSEGGSLNVFFTESPLTNHSQPFRVPQPVVYPLGPGAAVVQAGLLNGDSDIDLAVLNTNDGTVSTLLNQGAAGMYALLDRNTRTYPGLSHFSLALLPGRIASAADILVTSASDDTLALLRNDGLGAVRLDTGGDSQLSTLRGPVFVTAPTFPGMMNPTVYVAHSASNQVQIWDSDKGTLAAKGVVNVTPRPVALAADDLNFDGYPDIVVASSSRDELQILLSSPNGTYQPTSLDRVPTGQAPVAVAIADLNGDYE